MAKCSFCSCVIESGTGSMFVERTGEISWFCSNKCEKNIEIRDPRKVKWVVKRKG